MLVLSRLKALMIARLRPFKTEEAIAEALDQSRDLVLENDSVDSSRPGQSGSPMELPAGIDYAWLACDAENCVARFTNVGEGPIPAVVLGVRKLADRAEALIRDLPFVGQHELCIRLQDPTDFSRLARRGLYGYDWRDAMRPSERSHCYEIVSRPSRPVRVDDLPTDLRCLAELVRFGSVRFADADSICVGRLLECVL